jgi:hypothetical protein
MQQQKQGPKKHAGTSHFKTKGQDHYQRKSIQAPPLAYYIVLQSHSPETWPLSGVATKN